MRLRPEDLQPVFLKKRITDQDEKGNDVHTYADEPIELEMNVQSAGGAVNAQTYGERLPYIKSCKYQGDKIREGKNEMDGICVYVGPDQEPDFEIKSIHPYSTHTNVMLERRGGLNGSSG